MKLTVSLKRRITADWAEIFPALGIYKPMWLLRRIGPLVEGIYLNRDSSNERYQPIFHVHNLAKADSNLSLTLAEELRTARNNTPEKIKVAFHKDHYVDAARRMNEQALLPLSGDLHVENLVGAYFAYMERSINKFPLLLFEDVIMVLVWCGRNVEAFEEFVKFEKQVTAWPESVNVLQRAGGIRVWSEKCRRWMEQPDRIRAMVEEQAVVHGLENLPCGRLLNE